MVPTSPPPPNPSTFLALGSAPSFYGTNECDGDAICLKIVASLSHCWLHSAKKSVILSQNLQLIEFPAVFKAVPSPVRAWLDMLFSPRVGDATIQKKNRIPIAGKKSLV